MDDSTPQGYPGEADAAAGNAPIDFVQEDRWHKGLKDLRTLDLRDLAERVLEEAKADLWAWGPLGGSPRRQAHALDASLPGEGAVAVRLGEGSTAWLELTNRGANVFSEPLRSDRTILAALVTSATVPVDHTNRGDAERLWRSARTYVLLDSKGLMEPFDLARILEESRGDSRIGGIKQTDLLDAWKLRLHDALLRYYRPDYAELPDKERAVFLVECAKRVDAVLAAVRGLQDFLEEADITGSSKQRSRGDRYKGADPQRDVLAAELRGALGLKHREIAEFLDFPLPDSYRVTGKIPAVKNAIGRGEALLKQAFSDEGEYNRYIERIEPELKVWHEYISQISEYASRMTAMGASQHAQT